METLEEQVRKAHRRLVTQQFLSRLAGCLFVTLLAATAAIAAPKIVAIDSLPANWAEIWLGGAVVVALIAAGLWTYLRRRSTLDAAIEIDRRFDLRERVASSLQLPKHMRDDEVGKALVEDASKSIARIDVASRFPLKLGSRAWAPLLPAAIAVALMVFVGNREAVSKPSTDPGATNPDQIKKPVDELREQIAKKKKEAEEKELKEAAELLKQINAEAEKLATGEDADRKKATVKLNDLAEKLEERQKELGGDKAMREQLDKLGDMDKGPADKAARAMREGDWKKAMDELKSLQEKLAKGDMSKEDPEKLAEQFEKMKEKLQAAVEQQKQQQQDLKRQIEEQRRKGNMEQAGKLQEKLDQLQQQQPAMDKLQEMANKLGKAQQAMQKGDAQAAADAMQQMADQMQQMQQELEEMEMLADAMDQIEAAKNQMNCPGCKGQGCQQCQGGMQAMPGQMPGMGQGMGEGKGSGPRPDREDETAMRDTKVKQDPGAGDSVFAGEVEGPNRRGEVREDLKDELTAETVQPAEALDEQRYPRRHREHTEEFFKLLRDEL